jgi:hypothetical protein
MAVFAATLALIILLLICPPLVLIVPALTPTATHRCSC